MNPTVFVLVSISKSNLLPIYNAGRKKLGLSNYYLFSDTLKQCQMQEFDID